MTMSDKGAGQEHFKSNYIEVIKRIVPDYYESTEYNLFGSEEDLQYRVLGSILYLANNVSSLIGRPTTYYGNQVSSFSGNESFVPYFVPFNNLTDVSPTTYETYVLRPLGKTFGSFANKEAFSNFLLTSALPHTHVNYVTDYFAQQFSATVNPNITSVSAVSNTLIDKLGWVYFQNTSGTIVDSDSRAVSSFLYSSIMDNIYYGKRLKTSDGVRNLFKWLYYNCKGGTLPWDQPAKKFLPVPFTSPSSTYNVPKGKLGNFYASGGQLVSALDTLVNVWVNEDDPNSLYFRDIVNASLLGLNVDRMENAGPMSKMLKALAYGFYDVKNSIRDVQYLLDIEKCPEEFLQYLGRYLGWTFFSDDPDKWRDQLKQAIYLYKAKGTRQALANAVNMVIPSSIYNPVAPVSGLQELWESYIPNLLYYGIKTESPIGTSPLEYLEWKRGWSVATNASAIPLNLSNYDPDNNDNNVRFVVDSILELLNHKYNFIQIGGIPYKETAYWKSQEASMPPTEGEFVGNVAVGSNRPGYRYRDGFLTVPPWEENRFYQNCSVGPNDNAFIASLSGLLARPYDNAGCGLAASSAKSIATYITNFTSIKNVDGFQEPGWGDNNSFKFMTSSLQLPFNYSSVIRNGDLESMSVFDYWNSKSSEVHSKFHLSSLDFSSNDFTNLAKTKIGRKGIPTIVNIFRQFAPFHTLNKIYVGSGIEDDYWGTRYGPTGSDNAEIPWSGVMDLEVINTIQSDMDQLQSSYAISAFPGAWGAGGSFSGVGVFPSIWNPQGGRWIPSACLHAQSPNDAGDQTSYFWSGGVSGTQEGPIQPAPQGNKALKAIRTAGRRRDLKYKFTGWAQNRQGLNQPIATDWFGMSGGAPHVRPVYINRGLKIAGFAPKGFNFSSQQYVDTSGSLSSVYSYYNTSSTPFFELKAGEFFPARNIPDMETNASSFNQLRDVFGSQIIRAMTTIFMRRGRKDRRWMRFTDQGFENFKFGKNVQDLYVEYNNTFRRQLHCWIDQETQVDGDRYAGGFNILAHVFGPLLFNHNFTVRGTMGKNMGIRPFRSGYGYPMSSSHSDWSGVVATDAIDGNRIYVNTEGERVELTDGVLQEGAFGTYVNSLDTFESPSEILYSNRTLLSGIEFVSPPVNSIAVWNNPSNPNYNMDFVSPSGITFLQRAITDSPNRGIKVRYPLEGNINYSYNGNLKFPPRDDAKGRSATSAIAGWAMQDYIRTPVLNSAGSTSHPNTAITFRNTAGSAAPRVILEGKGGLSGVGVPGCFSSIIGMSQNPNLATIDNYPSRQTPPNLRPLTPGNSYKISLEASSNPARNNQSLTYVVINTTKDKNWVQSQGTWRDVPSTYSETLANVMTSGITRPEPGWGIFTGTITPSSIFEQGDNYKLIISPANLGATTRCSWQVRNIKIEDYEPNINKVTGGRQGNKLFKDQWYMLGINGRVAKIAGGLDSIDEQLFVRVVTDQKPFVGNGWETFARNWYYNWDTKSWATARDATLSEQWKALDFPGDSIDTTRHIVEFNTMNSRTPLKYSSLSKDGPLGGYFASAGPVHNDETVYYVEIGKPYRTGEFNGATLLGVDIVNKRYNSYAADYSRKDFVDIFDFFDDLNVSKSSRDARDSSGTYLFSGGSRSEYLEYWGGSHSATNGVYGFR